jgi:hypothetical protein
MIKRPFEQWEFEDVEAEFAISQVDNLLQLTNWLDTPTQNVLNPRFEKLRLSLSKNVTVWQEDELKMMFIALFLAEFDFNTPPHYRVFTQRTFKLETPTVEASGKVEWFVSTGRQNPKKPFFFLQEYKPEKTSGNDPLGQLLIAMVDAQILNDDTQKPLYGCYTLGRFWFFVVLAGKEYGISRAYDATQTDDMNAMIYILERVREHIHKELNLPYSFPF